MKGSFFSWTVLLLLTAISLAGQTKAKPRPTSFIESRQGNHTDGPDTIGHRTVSEADTVLWGGCPSRPRFRIDFRLG